MSALENVFVCGINTHFLLGGPYETDTPVNHHHRHHHHHRPHNRRQSYEDDDSDDADEYSDDSSSSSGSNSTSGSDDVNRTGVWKRRGAAQEWRQMTIGNWNARMSSRYILDRIVCGYDLTYLLMLDRERAYRHQLFVLGMDSRGLVKRRDTTHGDQHAMDVVHGDDDDDSDRDDFDVDDARDELDSYSNRSGGTAQASRLSLSSSASATSGSGSSSQQRSHMYRVNMSHLDNRNIVCISDYYSHCLIVTDDNMVYAAGYGSRGQLGLSDASLNNISLVHLQPIEFFRDKPVKLAVGGECFSLFVTLDNAIYSSGSNAFGQLGIGGDVTQRNVPTLMPFNRMYPNERIVDVKCGIAHAVILCASGNVYSVGQNYEWQCGRVGGNVLIPTPIDTLSGPVRSVRSIYCGYNSTYLLMQDGRVLACGSNTYGQLGCSTIEPTGNRSKTTCTCVDLTALDGRPVADIAPGFFHVVFTTRDGQLYGCGLNVCSTLSLSLSKIEN